MKKRNSIFGSYEMGMAVVGGLTAAFAIVFFMRMLSPVICEKARAKLQGEFTVICNEAVLSYMESENISYEDIIKIERGESGEIHAMNTDIGAVNKMKSEIALVIQRKINETDSVSVEFPTGGFFGFGGGFDIPVSLISVTALETDLSSGFEAAGINQTRLSITMTFQTKGKLIFAGEGEEVVIKTAVPVAQTVIVGDVPSTYLDVKKQ